MKFYIAARAKQKEKVKNLADILQEYGHVWVFNWPRYTDQGLSSPYAKDDPLPPKVAQESIRAIKNCDIFIIFPDSDGSTGMYFELGVAVAENKKCFAVGDNIAKPIFMFHPSVKHVASVEELLEHL